MGASSRKSYAVYTRSELLPPCFGIYALFFNCGGEITSYSVGVAALCIVGANAVAVKINKSALQLNGAPENKKMLNTKTQ